MRSVIRKFSTPVAVACLSVLLVGAADADSSAPVPPVIESEETEFRVETVASGLQIPWAMAFLPDGRAVVSERTSGRINLLDVKTGEFFPLEGGPEDVFIMDNAGMLDVVTHPAIASNDMIYFCYTAGTSQLNTMVVERARLTQGRLEDRERIFAALPWYHNSIVYGCRLAFQGDYLFVTMGDRWDLRHLSQSPGSHLGKVLRLNHDGSAPRDNPFVEVPGALPEVWSIGNRNPQGLTVHPRSGLLWEHEHGPLGGDEVNIIEAGLNYGWPVITYGKEYSGEPVGDGLTEKGGMEQPVHKYVPSIAPSDMLFYSGNAFPAWQDNLFIGALALKHINRLIIEDNKVIHEERLLVKQAPRVRFIEQGPDDYIYFGTDEGEIQRLIPVE